MFKELFIESHELDEAKAKRGRKGAGRGKPRTGELAMAYRFVDQYKNYDFDEMVIIPKEIRSLIMKKGHSSTKKILKEYDKLMKMNETKRFVDNSSAEYKKAQKNNLKFAKSFKSKPKKSMGRIKKAFLGILAGLMFITASAQAGIPVANNFSKISQKHHQAKTNIVDQAFVDAGKIFDGAMKKIDNMDMGTSMMFGGSNFKTVAFLFDGDTGDSLSPNSALAGAVFHAAEAGFSSADIQELVDGYIDTVRSIAELESAAPGESDALVSELTDDVIKTYDDTAVMLQKESGSYLSKKEVQARLFGKVKVKRAPKVVQAPKTQQVNANHISMKDYRTVLNVLDNSDIEMALDIDSTINGDNSIAKQTYEKIMDGNKVSQEDFNALVYATYHDDHDSGDMNSLASLVVQNWHP